MQRISFFTTPSILQALSQPAFLLLWSGQSVSRVGDYLYDVALAWWVLQTTGSATAMGAVLICALGPTVLFLLIGGAVVDRWPRVPVMFGADLVRGMVALGLAGLAATGDLQLWQICGASLLFGVAAAFFQPAYTATVPDVTPAPFLPSANTLTILSVQLSRVAGPALAAGLVTLGGAPLAFALNGLSFVIAALCLVPLLRITSAPVGKQQASLLADIGAGFRFVTRVPWLWMSIGLYALTNVTLTGPYSVALPLLVRTQLHAGADTLGLLYGIFPLGYILGGLWAGRQGRLRRRGRLIYGGCSIAGLMIAAFALPVPLPMLLLAALINGACLQADSLVWTHLLQEQVPPSLRGRVSSIDDLGSYALMPLGFALSGWATDVWGAPLVFLLGGGLTAVIAALGLLHPAIRHLD